MASSATVLVFLLAASAGARPATDDTFVSPVGSSQLRVVSPTLVELRLVTQEDPLPQAPPPDRVDARVDGRRAGVTRVGLRRRVVYAPLRTRDLRVSTSLLFALAQPLPEGGLLRMSLPPLAGLAATAWEARVDADRVGPALHASELGYLPGLPKRAFVGFFAGSLGEMPAPANRRFSVEPAQGGRAVLRGVLEPRPDEGMPGEPPAYGQVLQADFSALRTPGVYRLRVAGLGRSRPFRIDADVALLLARTYALGLYHQRCGSALTLPFTRHGHGACHLAPALVPAAGTAAFDAQLDGLSKPAAGNPRHTAPRLARLADALFPAVRSGPRDTSGGHHDAGDYGKYTIDSALLVHHLVFAADAFPGVAGLDDLGLPESGDGVSDVIQVARREVLALLKLQDDDGGFFFLVRPRDRAYEDDVLPDRGDPQIVFPKNTSATAAATAALAQAASSAAFRRAFPRDAGHALEAARGGWAFLQRAWARHGRAGAYQRVTHYGDVFEDRDEVAWAATEIFLATGDRAAHALLLGEFDPSRPESRRWGWWRLFEGYGAAARGYAFAALTGRAAGRALDPVHLRRCRDEVLAAGRDQAAASRASAYGTSYPAQGKRGLRAGWYFGENAVFDLVTAGLLADEAGFGEAVAGNLGYLTGANPVDVVFVTGLGPRAVRQVVHSYAVNDRRALPPPGLPVGNLQQGLPWIRPYEAVLRGLSLPADDGPSAYPIYDRYSETFNVTTEATVVDQGRALAAACALAARRRGPGRPWCPTVVRIAGLPATARPGTPVTLHLEGDAQDLDAAEVVWEAAGREPAWGRTFTLAAPPGGETWVEAEALWPDGRRASATALLVSP